MIFYNLYLLLKLELGLGRVKKSKNELKLKKFPSTQQTKSLCFEQVWMKRTVEKEEWE